MYVKCVRERRRCVNNVKGDFGSGARIHVVGARQKPSRMVKRCLRDRAFEGVAEEGKSEEERRLFGFGSTDVRCMVLSMAAVNGPGTLFLRDGRVEASGTGRVGQPLVEKCVRIEIELCEFLSFKRASRVLCLEGGKQGEESGADEGCGAEGDVGRRALDGLLRCSGGCDRDGSAVGGWA